MDINKLTTHLDNTRNAGQSHPSSDVHSRDKAKGDTDDKVTLGDYQFKKDEVLFAKTELEKHSRVAFEKLKELKAQLNEYEEAKADPAREAESTKMGKTLNDPDVWEKIARSILDR